jgi:hypothetical protein
MVMIFYPFLEGIPKVFLVEAALRSVLLLAVARGLKKAVLHGNKA